MYRFSEHGVVKERDEIEPGERGRSRSLQKALSCVRRSPSGVQVIALPHRTLTCLRPRPGASWKP